MGRDEENEEYQGAGEKLRIGFLTRCAGSSLLLSLWSVIALRMALIQKIWSLLCRMCSRVLRSISSMASPCDIVSPKTALLCSIRSDWIALMMAENSWWRIMHRPDMVWPRPASDAETQTFQIDQIKAKQEQERKWEREAEEHEKEREEQRQDTIAKLAKIYTKGDALILA
jgi:hypothetical protein